MATGECLAYSSLPADSEVCSLRLPGADWLSLRWPEWTLAHGFAADDSTINIIPVLFFLFIIHLFIFIYLYFDQDKHPVAQTIIIIIITIIVIVIIIVVNICN